MLGEVWEFVKAVFAQWGAIAFGAVASVLWWAYHKWSKGVEMPTWLFVTLLVVIGFFACFRAWQDQRAIAVEAKARVDEISRPRLAIEIQEFNSGIDSRVPNQTLITLKARVRNTGAPSIAESYNLKVLLASGKEVLTRQHYFDSVTLVDTVGTARRFTKEEHLPDKTVSIPIDRNSQRGGILWYYVDAPRSEFVKPGAIAVLSCADIFGNTSSDTYTVRAEHGLPKHYPGIITEFVDPSSQPNPQAEQSHPETKDDLKRQQP